MIFSPHEHFDNAAAANEHIDVRPLAAAMGRRSQASISRDVSDAALRRNRSRAVPPQDDLFSRPERITHGDQAAFSRRFGAFAEDAYTKGVPGHPDVQPLIKEPGERTGLLFGAGWHTDSAFLPEPPAISMLCSVQIPPFGGDTIWANSALAYGR